MTEMRHDGEIGPAAPLISPPVTRILAVDDDLSNLKALEASLADLGQPVVCARSGAEALRHVLRDDFAVILMDVLMPDMDGYETAAMIRSRDKSRHIPIIFLSAVNKDQTHLFRGYEAGAVDYVFKPVEPLILRSKVSVFIELHKRALEIRYQAELEKQLLAENLRVRLESARTAEALKRSLAQQSLVIEALPLALYHAEPEHGYRFRRFVGGRLEHLFGGKHDGGGDDWPQRIHPDDRDRVEAALRETLDGSVFYSEYRVQCADGSSRWFSDRAAIGAPDEHGRREQFGILLDTTERRQLEEQIVHTQKIEAVGQMTGGIAHDFNNMLSVIIGSLDRVLARPIEDAKLRSRLDLAMQAARSCADMTKRLLSFARRQSLEPRLLRLPDELSKLDDLFRRILGTAARLEIECPLEIWPVFLDPSQLEAALVNLVINARDAVRGDGLVRISASNCRTSKVRLLPTGLAPGDYVQLSVSDNGCGMTEEVKKRAFEPFFTTKGPARGTGLGLSSIHGFISQSQGAVTIDSEPGNGTTVRLFVPRASRAVHKIKPGRQDSAEVRLNDCRVLLVEDEPAVRTVTVSMLEDLGCDVIAVATGAEALEKLENHPELTLVVTDCVLPGTIDGPKLASEIRRKRPILPVLLISGYRGSGTTGWPRTGLEGFLPKPFSSESLALAVNDLMAAKR